MPMICPKNYSICNADITYNPRKIFVIMPFRESQAPQSLFNEIKSRMVGWQVEKANTDTSKPEVWCTICANIQESRAVIADLSGANPNVLLELGMVFGMSRPFVLLTQNYDDLTFDTQGFQVHKYTRQTADNSKIANPDSIIKKIVTIIEDSPELTPELFDASREGRLYRRVLGAKKIASDYWTVDRGKWSVNEIGDNIDKVVVCLLDQYPAPKNTSLISRETGISQRQALRIVTGESGSNSRFFEKLQGGYQLSDAGIYWALEEILPSLPKET